MNDSQVEFERRPAGKKNKNIIPTFRDDGRDHTKEWEKLLQGSESDFPTEASVVNESFDWPHIVNGKRRNRFDCRKLDSYRFIPPEAYLKAYREAKRRGEI